MINVKNKWQSICFFKEETTDVADDEPEKRGQ